MAYPNISHQGGAQRVTGRRHRFFDDHRQHGMDIKVARIFNTYGPRMHPNDGRVVPNFIVQALQGDPITLYGDSGQSRTFCYVDDLEGLLAEGAQRKWRLSEWWFARESPSAEAHEPTMPAQPTKA